MMKKENSPASNFWLFTNSSKEFHFISLTPEEWVPGMSKFGCQNIHKETTHGDNNNEYYFLVIV